MMNVASRRALSVAARKAATAGNGRSFSALVDITEEYPG
jgi:hypothetical protein